MKFLVDSDFLIALYKPNDSNYNKAKSIFKRIEKVSTLVALNVVFQESTTVISKQLGMSRAKDFFVLINKLVGEKIILDQESEEESWRIFLRQSKKGTSFVDCANLAVAQKYKLDGILSFDEFYPKGLLFR